jgi:hypothetical protein
MPISCATARDLGDAIRSDDAKCGTDGLANAGRNKAMMAYAHRHLVATNHQHQPVLG